MFTLLVYDAGMAIGVNVRAAEQFSSNPPATFERRARIELFFYYSPVEQDESLDAFAGQLASVIAAYRGGTHRAEGVRVPDAGILLLQAVTHSQALD